MLSDERRHQGALALVNLHEGRYFESLEDELDEGDVAPVARPVEVQRPHLVLVRKCFGLHALERRVLLQRDDLLRRCVVEYLVHDLGGEGEAHVRLQLLREAALAGEAREDTFLLGVRL